MIDCVETDGRRDRPRLRGLIVRLFTAVPLVVLSVNCGSQDNTESRPNRAAGSGAVVVEVLVAAGDTMSVSPTSFLTDGAAILFDIGVGKAA